MNEIKDIEGYVSKMDITIPDKLFWVSRVTHPVSQLIDIGCASGTLLKAFHNISPVTELIGIEESPEMIKHIYEGFDEGEAPFIRFHQSMDELMNECKLGAVLNLSSVLHEVYSYKNSAYIKSFWEQINRLEPEYITIRDMMWNDLRTTDANRNRIVKADAELIKNSALSDVFRQFENRWGEVKTAKELAHFLLKYRYQTNWDRELNENYFACTFADVDDALCENYRLVYHECFALPWTVKCARNDFGISFLPGTTHQKIIYKRR